jgi:hypothetical protein
MIFDVFMSFIGGLDERTPRKSCQLIDELTILLSIQVPELVRLAKRQYCFS